MACATMLRMPDITDPAIDKYATEHSSPEPALLTELAAETRDFSRMSGMMVGRLEGRFLKTLVAAVGARRVLEVGTFTGYSALSMAEALPADGRIVTCEIDPRHAEVAQRYFDKSPYAAMIELRLGPALETLRGLDETFDFAFIDADKPSYGDYYAEILPRLSRGGLICVDNVLWSGDVLDASATAESTVALRAFNSMVVNDSRVECVMLPIRDGVTLIRRT